MTRLGLISDIHADLASLTAALRLLHEHDAGQILCAGDLVEKGQQGDAVVALLRSESIPCVCGNHDETVIGNQAWLRENGDPSNPNYHARLLAGDTLDFLKNLPRRLDFEWNGIHILLAHGVPWSNEQYLYPNSLPDLYHRVAQAAVSGIVILGHTHQPMRVEVGGVLIVNPGSVIVEGSHTCAILDLPSGALEVFTIATGSRLPDTDFRAYRIE